VTEVDSPANYENCANAEALNPSKWPFDVTEFARAAKLSDIEHNYQKGKIIVADTGFDFAGDGDADEAVLAQTKGIFLRQYFHVLDVRLDPKEGEDLNRDGVYGNGGWAGVNLAGAHGERSAQSKANYEYRGHGVSVTALAMGGRQLDTLRRSGTLGFEIGEVNLVPNYNTPYISADFVNATVTFAKARGNEFDVVNLSLSSEEDAVWKTLATDADKRQLTFVAAAGNDGALLTSKDGVWPAALGGAAVTDDPSATSFITVGAHDGKRKWVKFSNFGPGVDVLAPGCSVPSYVLKLDGDGNLAGITEKSISGTSVAAPLVSFAAGLLAGNATFLGKPAAIKVRIQIGSDYDPELQSRAASSGVFNIAKVVGFKYDILEVTDEDHQPAKRLRYGSVTLATDDGNFKCDYGPPIALDTIKKMARGKGQDDAILVLATDDPTRSSKLTRHFCPAAALEGLKITFTDTETSETESIKMSNFWDFVARSAPAG
jgi:hypothetical protein